MQDIILWVRDTPLPMIIVSCGLACMILAIALEIPPKAGEPRLYMPRKEVPITGALLLLVGIPLLVQWPQESVLLRILCAYLP
jgi:hypothetical protein